MRLAFFKIFLFVFIAISLFATSCRSHKSIVATHQTIEAEDNDHLEKTSLQKVRSKYSTLLGIDNTKLSDTLLYSFVDEWYNTPYKYGGRNKKGIDCSNFASLLYLQVYNKSLSGSSLSISNQCIKISKSELAEGDLVFFKIENSEISHIGVYLQNNKFVHATTKKGVIIDDLDEPYYKKYFYTGGRLK